MKNLVILGGGTAGTMMLNKLRKALDRHEWNITIVDKNETHLYQSGFLFIPFGIYSRDDVIKRKKKFYPNGVDINFSDINMIKPDSNKVFLNDGTILLYDYLIIATGSEIRPDEIPANCGINPFLTFIR